MKIIVLATILLCATVLTSAPVGAQDLTIVFEDYPPYEYIEDNEVKGINVELIREAFKRMAINPQFEPRPWKRALYELKNGDILALSSGFKTPERETYGLFPSEPLAMETVMVIALKTSAVEINSLEDLRGLKVGVIREYAYGNEFDTLEGLTKVEANSNPRLLQMLLNQRMDVIIGNKAVFKHLAKSIGQLAHIRFAYEITNEPLYLFFSRARGQFAENLSKDFGKAIKTMHDDGTFKAIEDRY